MACVSPARDPAYYVFGISYHNGPSVILGGAVLRCNNNNPAKTCCSCTLQHPRDVAQQAARTGLELVCMRPSLVLGPGDTRLSSCGTVLSLMEGRVPLLPRGGVAVVDVRDAAAAFVVAMGASGAVGRTFLLSAANMPCAEYFALVCEAAEVGGCALSWVWLIQRVLCAQVRPPWLRLPRWLTWLSAAALWRAKAAATGQWDPTLDPVLVEMGNAWWYADSSAAVADLGFSPRPVEQTIADTVAWLKLHRHFFD